MPYGINGDAMIQSFAVPRSVVEKSLRFADGNGLKILLFILSDTTATKSIEELSKALGFSPAVIKESITFWIDEGVLKSTALNETPLEEAEQLKQLRKQLVSQKVVYSPGEINTLFKEKPELVDIRECIEGIKGKPLTRSELNDIAILGDHYGLSGHFLMTVIAYCEETKQKNMKNIRSTAETFFISGVDEDTIDNYVSERLEYFLCVKKTRELLGLEHFYLNKRDMKTIESWKNVLKVSDELIVYAHGLTLAENNGATIIPYQNKILSRWAKQGIKTLEEAEKDTESFKLKAMKTTYKQKKKEENPKEPSIYENLDENFLTTLDEPL